MIRPIDEAKSELEAAQSALDAALRAWDESVSELHTYLPTPAAIHLGAGV